MTKFIRVKILGGKTKSQSSASVFLGLIMFAIVTTLYYFFIVNTAYIFVRSALTVLMIVAFVAVERSRANTMMAAFLTPFLVVLFLTIGAIYFDGDFLLYMYTLCGAMFALSYFNPKGLLAYIWATALVQGVFLFVFGGNLLGPNFTRPQQYFGFVAVIIINLMIYSFSKSYQKASRAKEIFLTNISHEIRTPITSVLGISEIGVKNATPETEEAFSRIHDSSRLLLRIINDILDFSKLQEGKMPIVQEEFSLATTISNVSHMYYGDNRKIKFTVSVDPRLPATLEGDSVRVEQVLVNLLSNSFKYTDKGNVTLKAMQSEADGEAKLIFIVADTGLGMSQKQLAIIHGDYVRFHEKSRHRIAGTGLGMSIVHKLVDLMRGSIKIESEVDRGTVVTVTLPQHKVGKAIIGEDVARRLASLDVVSKKPLQAAPVEIQDKSVLVVDDMEMNLFVAKGLLARYGLNVETCESGKEAVEKIKAGSSYHLIFMDNMMPDMSGQEALVAIRELGYTAPIVAFTADAVVGMKEEYIKNGFDGFLSKPIITDDLAEILEQFL